MLVAPSSVKDKRKINTNKPGDGCLRRYLTSKMDWTKLSLKFILLIIISGCTGNKSALQTVDFGDFTIKLPSNYKEHSLNNIDSYASRIKLDWGELTFDYGLYGPKLILSQNEFLESREWEHNVFFFAIIDPRPMFLELEQTDSHFVAKYDIQESLKSSRCLLNTSPEIFKNFAKIEGSTLYYSFELPRDLYEIEFFVEERDSIFQRVFVPYNLNSYKSGVYLLNRNSCMDEYNCWQQLSLWTSDSVETERDILVEILKSVEFKRNVR